MKSKPIFSFWEAIIYCLIAPALIVAGAVSPLLILIHILESYGL
jgi:hypothetical protein